MDFSLSFEDLEKIHFRPPVEKHAILNINENIITTLNSLKNCSHILKIVNTKKFVHVVRALSTLKLIHTEAF